MIRRLIYIVTLLSMLYFEGFSQSFHFVKVLPGIGIVYDNDSILLRKTSLKEVCSVFKIKEPDESYISSWQGFDSKTGESIDGSYIMKEIKYRSIVFRFMSDIINDESTYELGSIIIKSDVSLKIYTDNGIEMGEHNPNIKEIYPELGKQDHISDDMMSYGLNGFGVSFILERIGSGELKLIEIAVFNEME